MSKEEYNKKWIELNQKIQKLNKDRVNLYKQYQKEFGTLNLTIERSVSLYYDFNGDDIDLNEERKLVNQNKGETNE